MLKQLLVQESVHHPQEDVTEQDEVGTDMVGVHQISTHQLMMC